MSRIDEEKLYKLIVEKQTREKYNQIKGFLPETGPLSRDKYPKALELYRAGKEFRERANFGANRPLSDLTKVPMANGTTKLLKDIEIGDKVLGVNLDTLEATPTTVIDIPYIGKEEAYEIQTNRGQSVIGTSDHCFPVWNRSGKRKKLVKHQISDINLNTGTSCKKGLASPSVIHYLEEDLPLTIHPYKLGCLLGDGSLHKESVTFSNIDEDVLQKFKEVSEFDVTKIKSSECDYLVRQSYGYIKNVKDKGLLNRLLSDLGLKVRGELKFIPRRYLTSSVSNREELLAGLIDTDGSFKEFTNKSKQLVKDFCTLVRSLGGYANYKQVNKTCMNTGAEGTYYRSYFRINRDLPVKLRYKLRTTKKECDYTRHPIKNVCSKGVQGVRCITVDHPDHTFLVNDNLITYNCGKTISGSIEVAYHLTGLYPDWWEGYRFDKPITLWAVGVDTVQVKNVIQKLLLGPDVDFGSGMIPKDKIVGRPTSKPGAASGTVEDVYIKHVSGGISKLTFKSYQQSVKSFYGDAIDFIWFDEEPPRDIYDECMMRLVSTNGLSLATFTPLDGYSDVVMQFLPNRVFPADNVVNVEGVSKYIIRTEWEDVPHLDEKAKSELLASIQPHMREARSKGIPCVGEGKIYPVEEKTIIINGIMLEPHWKRVYSLSVSHKSVNIIFAAIDEDKDTVIIYDEYTAANLSPEVNATTINKRGSWMQGTFRCDARTNKQAQLQIYNQYLNEGLNLHNSDSELGAGISATLGRLITGRLKVLSTCENWIQEFRGYAYDESGNIKGKSKNLAQDDLMEATHDLILSGINIACVKPENNEFRRQSIKPGRNSITGY